MKVIHVLIGIMIAMVPCLAEASHWSINSKQSVIDFEITNMKVMTVKGTFRNINGEVIYDENNFLNSKVTAEIDAKTVSTGNVKRDKHLITSDFLDVERHKTIKFTATKLVIDNYKLKIHGYLTIRSITKNVILDAGANSEIEKQLKDKTHCNITATTVVNRNDFDVDNNKFLTYGIGNNVHITLNIGLDKSE